MSDSPESVAKQSSANESESSGGFRSFWKRSDRSAQGQNVTFVPQDPSTKQSRYTKTVCVLTLTVSRDQPIHTNFQDWKHNVLRRQ